MKLLKFLLVFLFFLTLFGFVAPAFAQDSSQVPPTEYSTAQVKGISEDGVRTIEGVKNRYQTFSATFLTGKDKGKTLTVKSGYTTTLMDSQIVRKGETVVLASQSDQNGHVEYIVYDEYRINPVIFLTICFFLVVIFVARWKGIGSMLGLVVSLGIIFLYIVPQILHGSDPLTVIILGSLVILFITTYLAHGISKQTSVALVSTFIALLITAFLATLFVALAHLTGFNDETSTLQFGATSTIPVKGLLLGGIIIGTLGALNDITTSQAAAVFELAATDAKLSFKKLFSKGFAIGREHVVSMVNTLVLAYAGSSLALFLFIGLNPQKFPLWMIINSEDVSDEIIRALAGGIGLVLVVPIVTLLAVLICNKDSRWVLKSIILRGDKKGPV